MPAAFAPAGASPESHRLPADRIQGILDAATMLAGKGKKQEAFGKYKEVLDSEPAHPEALAWVEDYLRTKRDYGQLRDVLLASVRAMGSVSDASISGRKERLREVAGLCEGNLRDIDGAINAWKQLLALDRIDEAARDTRLFSHNRFNLASFYDADFGLKRPGALRNWAEGVLDGACIDIAGGRIRLLCLPRLLGFAFNPISMWYCEHRDGSLRAVIAQVRNTFGESHSYLLAADGKAMPYEQRHEKEKCFHVSPFFDLVGRYRFALNDPGERVRVAIHETRDGVPILDATLAGEYRELTDAAILKLAFSMPLMTLKVVAGIHWEALKIWLRGGKFHPKPAPPTQDVT